MNKLSITLSAMLCILSISSASHAQDTKTYLDGKRGEVLLPMGDLSFADRVISYRAGGGKIKASASDPQTALGAPNYSGKVTDGSFISLGCDGALVLQFTDNALVNLEGPDLYVFEVGPRVEGTQLDISTDGSTWRNVGTISGGRAEVDISSVASAGESFRYIRLTDDGVGCGTNYAGADIDAVAAIGSAMRFVLNGSVLFAHDSSALLPEAQGAIEKLADQIKAAGLTKLKVVGHTDSTGGDDYNQALSNARALAVRDFLSSLPIMDSAIVTAQGRGESEPVSSNETEAGREQNRRVEIVGSASR